MEKTQLELREHFRVAIGNARSQAAEMVLEPGQTEGGPENHHQGADQWLLVVSGDGVAVVEGARVRLSPNTLLLIERGENHEIQNTGSTPLRTLNIYVPKAYSADGEPLPAGQRE